MIELLVAVTLLSAVVLALAASSMYTNRTLGKSSSQLGASKFVQSELERLQATPFDSLSDGSRTTTDGTSSWNVTTEGDFKRIVLITHFAPAETVSEWDTVAAFKVRPR